MNPSADHRADQKLDSLRVLGSMPSSHQRALI
jgi:hypothetical protein